MRPAFHPIGVRLAAPVVHAPPAPPAAPEAREEVLEHHVEAPTTATPENASQRPAPTLPEVIRSFPVSDVPEGRLAVEIIERRGRRRLAIAWTNHKSSRRVAVEVTTAHAAKLLEVVRIAAGELGVALAGDVGPQRDRIFDMVAGGYELVGGKWTKPAPEPRGRR